MAWLQLRCHTLKEQVEQLNDFLEEHECLSLTWQDAEDDPILEPLPGEMRLWDQVIVTALFDDTTDVESIVEAMRAQSIDMQNVNIEKLEDQVWERSWMEHFQPMQFGKKLWIYPSGYDTPNDDSVIIRLDPGLAFGTGTHPTTALCLEWLDANPPNGKTIIDYGCGSGILGIAAIKLGAIKVLATDIDEQALVATQSNMLSNDIATESIDTFFPEAMPEGQQCELMIANILSGPLAELAPHFAQLTQAGGGLVLSGILHKQEQDVIEAYTPWFENLTVARSGDWSRISGVRLN